MSYDQTMSSQELQRCSRWSDINNLINRGWIQAGTTLGIHLKYSLVGNVWVGSHVDWLYEGMRVVMRQRHLDVDMLYVCNFTARSPNVVVVMRVVTAGTTNGTNGTKESSSSLFSSSSSSTTVSTLLPPLPPLTERVPLKWSEQHDGTWTPLEQREERRAPSVGSEKYKTRMLPWMCKYLNAVNAYHVLLHEPGFNFILPAMLEWREKNTSHRLISCCAASDAVQLADVATRIARRNARENSSQVDDDGQSTTKCVLDSKDVLRSSKVDAVVLMSDGGVRTWKDLWYAWCVDWMREMDTREGEKAAPCLIFHVAASSKHAEELLREIITESGMSMETCSHTIKSYQWQQTLFTMVAVLFYGSEYPLVGQDGGGEGGAENKNESY